MSIWSVITAPWAITPPIYEIILEVGARHYLGEKLTREQIDARIAENKRHKKPQHDCSNVAVVELSGVIAKRMGMFDDISGGASTEAFRKEFREALNDQSYDAIMLYIDSPGGAVDGTQEMAQEIFAARGRKRIVAFSDGSICSAAYWLASAADEVYISGGNVAVGSIGVVCAHVDRSKMEEMVGRKTTEIFAGKYKRIATGYAPLSKEGREVMQSQVDHIYSVFVDDIAAHRGESVETVLAKMADGRVFLGQQAVDAGLVDGIRTFDDVLQDLSAGAAPGYNNSRRRAEKEDHPMPNPPTGQPNPAPTSVTSPGHEAVNEALSSMKAELDELRKERAADKAEKEQLQAQLQDLLVKNQDADLELILNALEAEGKSLPTARESTKAFLKTLNAEQLTAWRETKKLEQPQIILKSLAKREDTRPGGEPTTDKEDAQLKALLAAAPPNPAHADDEK